MIEKAQKFECKKCQKEFLVIQQENAFYKKRNLPIPPNCPECRRERRNNLRNKKELFDRKCDKCKIDMLSTYPKESPYIIYCEKCYFNEIGGIE